MSPWIHCPREEAVFLCSINVFPYRTAFLLNSYTIFYFPQWVREGEFQLLWILHIEICAKCISSCHSPWLVNLSGWSKACVHSIVNVNTAWCQRSKWHPLCSMPRCKCEHLLRFTRLVVGQDKSIRRHKPKPQRMCSQKEIVIC